MEGDKGGIFSEVSDRKSLSLFKIKIKTQAGQIRNIMQSSSTFIRISGSTLQVQKTQYLSIIGKVLLYVGKNGGKQGVG